MGRPRKYSDELRRRAVDEVLERDRKARSRSGECGRRTTSAMGAPRLQEAAQGSFAAA